MRDPGDTVSEAVFLDQESTAAPTTRWRDRAVALAARPLDAAQGSVALAAIWSRDGRSGALAGSDLDRLVQHLSFATLPAGCEAIAQDEAGDFLLIVLSGVIAVDRVQPSGRRIRMAEAHAGDMLGEMSLLDAGTRSCACSTLKESVVAVLDNEHFDLLMRDEPRLAVALLASLSRRLSLRLRQVSSRLSALLSQG